MTFVVLLFAGNAGAQSVTIGAIPGSRFCVGDPISVPFTATGFWGHRNAFTLQLSDEGGSFSNFQNVGSLLDTLPGTFTINSTIPLSANPSGHYRFRIVAALPYTVSADNGSDIAIGRAPNARIVNSLKGGAMGTPITFTDNDNALYDTAFWDFGSGANPATAITTGTFTIYNSFDMYGKPYLDTTVIYSQDVTYSTTGEKTVTLRLVSPGGCSATMPTHVFHIYDCSNPSIPHDAVVINADTTVERSGTYWVNPGFKLTLYGGDTIFAESGSTISGLTSSGPYGNDCVIYMKRGSELILPMVTSCVIYGDGANVEARSSFTLHCPTLDFDYSNAPPNVAHPSAVRGELKSISITLSPNPTRGMVQVQGLPSENTTVSVFNILGEVVEVQKNLRASECTLNLSKLVSGAYYVRISSSSSVVTKKVVRE